MEIKPYVSCLWFWTSFNGWVKNTTTKICYEEHLLFNVLERYVCVMLKFVKKRIWQMFLFVVLMKRNLFSRLVMIFSWKKNRKIINATSTSTTYSYSVTHNIIYSWSFHFPNFLFLHRTTTETWNSIFSKMNFHDFK